MPRPPLVFIYRGNSPHLAMAVCQAKWTHPDREVVLIGDSSTRHFERFFGVRHVPLANHWERASELEKIYTHLSTMGPEFELFCLQRWFVLLEWMRSDERNNRCIHLDSDVLVFSDLALIEDDFASAPMTYIHCSAHTSFINSRETLADFCEMIESYYRSDELRTKLRSLYYEYISSAGAGGISDMTFLRLFHQENPNRLIPIDEPVRSRFALDLTLDSGFGGYALRDGKKAIEWSQGMPICRHIPSGKDVAFLTLHFQGKSKAWMGDHFVRMRFKTRLSLRSNEALILGSRIWRKVLRGLSILGKRIQHEPRPANA